MSIALVIVSPLFKAHIILFIILPSCTFSLLTCQASTTSLTYSYLSSHTSLCLPSSPSLSTLFSIPSSPSLHLPSTLFPIPSSTLYPLPHLFSCSHLAERKVPPPLTLSPTPLLPLIPWVLTSSSHPSPPSFPTTPYRGEVARGQEIFVWLPFPSANPSPCHSSSRWNIQKKN